MSLTDVKMPSLKDRLEEDERNLKVELSEVKTAKKRASKAEKKK